MTKILLALLISFALSQIDDETQINDDTQTNDES